MWEKISVISTLWVNFAGGSVLTVWSLRNFCITWELFREINFIVNSLLNKLFSRKFFKISWYKNIVNSTVWSCLTEKNVIYFPFFFAGFTCNILHHVDVCIAGSTKRSPCQTDFQCFALLYYQIFSVNIHIYRNRRYEYVQVTKC